MNRGLALILALIGLFSPFALSGLSACASCATTESIASCCELDNGGAMRCCVNDACERHCSTCICKKQADLPSAFPRADRETELSTTAALWVAVVATPHAAPEPAFNFAIRATESPPHLGAIKTIRLAI